MPPNVNRGGRPRGTKQQRKLHAEIERGNAFERAIQDKHDGDTYTAAAQRQGLPTSTLWHREHGHGTRAQGHEHLKKLTTIEENELRDWLKELDDWGIHLSHDIVRGRANDILAERGSKETVGKTWIRRFMSRFPELRTGPSEKKDVSRNAAERDPVRFDKYFKMVSILVCLL